MKNVYKSGWNYSVDKWMKSIFVNLILIVILWCGQESSFGLKLFSASLLRSTKTIQNRSLLPIGSQRRFSPSRCSPAGHYLLVPAKHFVGRTPSAGELCNAFSIWGEVIQHGVKISQISTRDLQCFFCQSWQRLSQTFFGGGHVWKVQRPPARYSWERTPTSLLHD